MFYTWNTHIGIDNDVIAEDFCIETRSELGNLLDVIRTSGKLVLDHYYNMDQTEIRLEAIDDIADYYEVTHFKFQQLFAWKQYLLESDSLSHAIKPHAIIHAIHNIQLHGSPRGTNTDTFEHLNGEFGKDAYFLSSRRCASFLEEMTKGLQYRHFLQRRNRAHKKNIQNETRQYRRPVVTHTTEADLVWEARIGSQRESVYLIDGKLSAESHKNLYEGVSLVRLWENLKLYRNDRKVNSFIKSFMDYTPGNID